MRYEGEPTVENRNALVEHYLGFVVALAKLRWKTIPKDRGCVLDDLVSDGVIGLIEAISAYEPSQKTSFLSYAKHRVRGAILDCLRSFDHASSWQRRKGTAKDQVPICDDLADESNFESHAQVKDDLEMLFRTAELSREEREVLISYFGLEKTAKAIAKDLSLSSARVSQLKLQAMDRVETAVYQLVREGTLYA